MNVCYILCSPCGGRCGGPPTPSTYDCDAPRIDRSQLRGDVPDPLLTISRSIRKGESK